MLGDYMCVNGVHKVFRSEGTTSFRLRILNGSNARIYDLALTHALPFPLIGTDCGLLDQSHSIDSLTLAPGERADVLVNFSQQKINTVVDLIDKNNNDQRLLQFLIEKKLDDDFTLPKNFQPWRKSPPKQPSKPESFNCQAGE
jgi:blue copper oxidase